MCIFTCRKKEIEEEEEEEKEKKEMDTVAFLFVARQEHTNSR